MQVPVNAEIFLKFAMLARNNSPDDERKYLRSVLIEVANGSAFIFATDSKFAAVQRLGPMSGEFKACITVDDTMTNQAEAERHYSSSVIVTSFMVSTSLGFVYPGNPFVAPPQGVFNKLLTWRDLFKPKGNGAGGSMFLDADRMKFLIDTSPSGCVLFPPKIDASAPIIVKDSLDSNWLGVFIGQSETSPALYGAQPEWLSNV